MAIRGLVQSRYDQNRDLAASAQRSCDCMKIEASGVSESWLSIVTENRQEAEGESGRSHLQA